ncbi:hypothetical protein DQ384_03900 [Sphaerisporangium album]|uniref:Uncharacterized protein n=1 Tax=Sphaerisporangium album TaxID=509200 RepID=A0A367FQI0_9ACTN|nr:hypothetical protein [Sphaerisporangium album]RCG32643.1 hypothetical protein DQ384_03900 [Sphaerisporangium album]
MLRARTLVEAYLYIDLTLAGGDDEDDGFGAADEPGLSARPWTTLTEGADAWTLRFDGPATGPRHLIDVVVPYETEAEARRDRLRFGSGVSELVDAGQWRMVSDEYAQRALSADLSFADTPEDDERYREVVLNWEFARDALAEAAKFLPGGADEVPATAFWTDMGTAVHEEDPGRFTRSRLEDDIAFYEENLQHFTDMYGDR